jgi:acetolactate synthase-1/2/3 large subunit
MDSIPIVAITGQVPLSMIGTDAFQEIDTYGLTLPITKQNYLVRSPEELFEILPEAFYIASEGRPGPVVIDVPKNIQIEKTEIREYKFKKNKAGNLTNSLNLEKIINVLEESKKPVLYIGGGIIQGNAGELVRELADKQSLPIVSTLMGLSAIPSDHPNNLGMLGMHAAPYTNYVLEECDLLITLGVRFDDRATGKVAEFCKNAKIIHIDIDESEIGKIKIPNFSFVSDVKVFLEKLNPIIPQKQRPDWIARVNEIKEAHPLVHFFEANQKHPLEMIKTIGLLSAPDTIVTTDVGQHQMWVAQCYPFVKPGTWLTSGGLGTMGFGLPAAIGAAFAYPEKKILCFTGDGSLLMNIQELDTLAEFQLNIKIIILNNGHLGLVRQQQELFYKENFIASKYHKPADFVKIGNAFGINSFLLDSDFDFESKIKTILNGNGPSLVNIPIIAEEKVFPMVPPGAANRDMILPKVQMK